MLKQILNNSTERVMGGNGIAYNKGKFLAQIGEMSEDQFHDFCENLGYLQKQEGKWVTSKSPLDLFDGAMNRKSDSNPLIEGDPAYNHIHDEILEYVSETFEEVVLPN